MLPLNTPVTRTTPPLPRLDVVHRRRASCTPRGQSDIFFDAILDHSYHMMNKICLPATPFPSPTCPPAIALSRGQCPSYSPLHAHYITYIHDGV